MKKALMSLGVVLAVSLMSTSAWADYVYGKVVGIFSYGTTYFGYTGGITVRKADMTYAFIATTPAMTDASLGRLLNACTASATTPLTTTYPATYNILISNIAAIYSGYSYSTTATTGFQFYNY